MAPTAKQPDLIVEPDASSMANAIAALRCGELIAFPTETVYGIGADACNSDAVSAIFRAKGRPFSNPLIVHVKDLATARQYGSFNETASRLAAQFWPGALTLVVPQTKQAKSLSPLVSGGLETIALRVPVDNIAHELLLRFDGPIAAPSANRSGRLSPTEAEHVEEMLGDQLSLILDGGPCVKGLESTIIGFEGDTPLLLRPGAIPRQQIERVLGFSLKSNIATDPDPATAQERPSAPGQLASHYAPRASLRLNASSVREAELMLAFGPDAPKGVAGVNLSPTGDLFEAGVNLYAYLHLLDGTGIDTIAVMPIPFEGLGEAINDRLRRAAAPRPELENEDE